MTYGLSNLYCFNIPIKPSIFIIPLWVHFSYFLFAYIRIEIRVSIYYMYGLTATGKNTRNNSFSISKIKEDKECKSLLIEFFSATGCKTYNYYILSFIIFFYSNGHNKFAKKKLSCGLFQLLNYKLIKKQQFFFNFLDISIVSGYARVSSPGIAVPTGYIMQ